MIRQTKYKSIVLIIILLIFFSSEGKSQPGYPENGFVIFFNADFVDFPSSLKSEHSRARYLDTLLSIIFIDSTKTIESGTFQNLKCSYRTLSVDTNNRAKLLVYIGDSYGYGECYDDKYVIKDLSLSSQSKGTVYWYSLDSSSKARFLLTKDKEDLHFNFYSNNSGFQEVFGIQQIYDTQKDLIEELITKSQMYDFHARKILQNSFSKLKMHPDLYLRTLVGTYIQEKDIHKRPMTKFIQDIARDLGIID